MRLQSNDRHHCHRFFVWRFNRTRDEAAAHLAMWHLLLHLAFDQPEEVNAKHH